MKTRSKKATDVLKKAGFETRGGQRENAGRKSPFKEKTKGVKFMCPESKVGDLKKCVNRKLLGWSKGGI